METVALLDYVLMFGADDWTNLGTLSPILMVRHNCEFECETRFLHVLAMYSLQTQGTEFAKHRRHVMVARPAPRVHAPGGAYGGGVKPKPKKKVKRDKNDPSYKKEKMAKKQRYCSFNTLAPPW
jgi:hypothetical protein